MKKNQDKSISLIILFLSGLAIIWWFYNYYLSPDNQGVVEVFASNGEALKQAMARIKGIVAVPEVGEIYKGKVKAVAPYGAFVEIIPGKDGLLHVSEISWERIDKPEDHLEVGQEIEVKLIGLDPKTGKLRLSRKVLLEKPVAE